MADLEDRWLHVERIERLAELSSSDDDDDNYVNVIIRREYKIQKQIDMDKWDDNDFVYRFRLEKSTVLEGLQLIADKLPCDERRYVQCV